MSKRIGLIAAFLIVACLSFFITKGLKDSNSNEETSKVFTSTEPHETSDDDADVVVTNEIKGGNESPVSATVIETDDTNKIVLKASKPIMSEDKTYSFKASFNGNVTELYRYELWNLNHNQLVQSSDDGNFVNVPPIEKGVYRLYLVNKETGKNIVPPITVNRFVPVTTPDPGPVAETNTDAESTSDIVKKSAKFKSIKLQYKNNKYSFRASIAGELTEPYHYELLSGDKMIAKSDDGFFEDIPPVDGGSYTLRLVSEGEVVASTDVKGFKDNQKKLITKEEFQKRMLDPSDHTLDGSRGRATVVTKNFRVVLVNTNVDFEVSDVQDVRDMIKTYNKWKGARVVELEYDAQGYVTLAKIEPDIITQ